MLTGFRTRRIQSDLEEGITDARHVVLWRVTRHDQALHDLDQVRHGLTQDTAAPRYGKECADNIGSEVRGFRARRTFLNRFRASGFCPHSSVMSTTAPCSTPTPKMRQNRGNKSAGLRETRGFVQLTVVLLREEGSSCRGKKLPQIRDLPHNVNSAESSLEEQSPGALRRDLRFQSAAGTRPKRHPPSSSRRSWMPGAAAQSREPDLCTSQQNPYRPEYTEPETVCTGFCERGRWGQKKMKHNSEGATSRVSVEYGGTGSKPM